METEEPVPSYPAYTIAGSAYAIALAAALRRAARDHRSYEFVGALHRLAAVPDAEARWLAGEDVLAGVRQSSVDILTVGRNPQLYAAAFA
jgi:hypothetical protein